METQPRRTDCGHRRGRGGGADGENSLETRVSPSVGQTASGDVLCIAGSWGNLEGWEGAQEGVDVCIPMADSW